MANAVEKKDILFSSALIKHKLQMLKIQKSNKSRVFYLIFLSFIVIMIMIFSCYHRYYNYRFLYHHYDNWYFCFHFYHFVECPNLTFKHSSYIISLSGESWRSNRGACQRQGGDLVSIETEEEWNFINNEIQKRNAAHYQNKWSVGLKKMAGNWTWVSGRPLIICKWGQGEPSGKYDAAFIYKRSSNGERGVFGSADSRIKENWLAFVCEISKSKFFVLFLFVYIYIWSVKFWLS